MNDVERLAYHCDTWNKLYSNCEKSKNIIGDTPPFDLIKTHGSIFSCKELSEELKSDEEQLLKKAITRIGIAKKTTHQQRRFSIPVKTFLYEKSDKIKLWYGIVTKNNLLPTELAWITINNKIVDLSNESLEVKGIIPESHFYCGIEIPKDIARNTISNGLTLEAESENWSLEPNHTTIFIQSFNELKKYYEINSVNNLK